MSVHERPEEAAAYLLGELDPERAAAFERALAEDDALRAEVERLRPVVSRLARMPSEAWEGEEPPPLRLPPAGADRSSRRRRLRGPLVLRPALAAALAALLLAGGIGVGTLLDGGGDDGNAPAVRAERSLRLRPIGDDPAARGRVIVARGDRPHVTLRVDGLAPSRAREFYELWLLGRDGQLVALGSFRVDSGGTTTLRLPLPVEPEDFSAFDVSIQPQDGDASHSGNSVLRGPTRI